MKMNTLRLGIFLIHNPNSKGYDTFSDMVVIADSVDVAVRMHPRIESDGMDRIRKIENDLWMWCYPYDQEDWYLDHEWAGPISEFKATYIGLAKPFSVPSVILSSFHAG